MPIWEPYLRTKIYREINSQFLSIQEEIRSTWSLPRLTYHYINKLPGILFSVDATRPIYYDIKNHQVQRSDLLE